MVKVLRALLVALLRMALVLCVAWGAASSGARPACVCVCPADVPQAPLEPRLRSALPAAEPILLLGRTMMISLPAVGTSIVVPTICYSLSSP